MTYFLDPPSALRVHERAAASVIPVPYDATSTWVKGADQGPAALLQASTQVEWLDIETETEPYRRGIATLPAIEHQSTPDELAPKVARVVGDELDAGRIPVVLGGEHSVSIGAIQAAAARHPDLTVLQIDAHADTRETYHGSAYNHACVMARAREVARIVQVGIRSLEAEELAGLERDRVFFAHDIRQELREAWIERVCGKLSDAVYLTIDLDAFDPSLVPATGTPEPGGLGWWDVQDLVRAVCARSRIVGFDVVELCPRDGEHASDFVAAKLVHRVLAEIFVSQAD